VKATAEVCHRWTVRASSHWAAVLCHAGPVDGEATSGHAGTAAPGAPTKEEVPGVERLLALSDGVVAIAITLLVLQLGGSTIRSGLSVGGLAHALAAQRSQFTAYVTSFYVVAQFWFAHHRVFRMVRGHDEGLAWWNFGFLFTITLMPFTSELLGRQSGNSLAVTIFAANLLLASLCTQVVLVYGRRRKLLVTSVTAAHLAAARDRGLAVTAVVVLVISLAWITPANALYGLLLLLVVPPCVAAVRSRRARRAGRPAGS